MDKTAFRTAYKFLVALNHAKDAVNKAEKDVLEIAKNADVDDFGKQQLGNYASVLIAKMNLDYDKVLEQVCQIISSLQESHEEEVRLAMVLASHSEIKMEEK